MFDCNRSIPSTTRTVAEPSYTFSLRQSDTTSLPDLAAFDRAPGSPALQRPNVLSSAHRRDNLLEASELIHILGVKFGWLERVRVLQLANLANPCCPCFLKGFRYRIS